MTPSGNTGEEIIFRHARRYEPVIVRKAGALFYSMPVDSSFTSFSVDVPITEQDFDVLTTDLHRFLLLYAVLHQPCQLPSTMPCKADFRTYLDMILHRPLGETERYVAQLPYVAYHFDQIVAARAREA